MDQRLAQKIGYWSFIFVTVAVVVLAYYRIKDETSWREAGTRFTGEDAVWLIENSNIRIEKKQEIPGASTWFREYIRGKYGD